MGIVSELNSNSNSHKHTLLQPVGIAGAFEPIPLVPPPGTGLDSFPSPGFRERLIETGEGIARLSERLEVLFG